MLISEFYEKDFCQYAMYDNYRSISSYIDCKVSARKIIYTVKKLNINTHERVCDIASDVSKQTKYKHGNVSLEGVVVGLAQDFPCANNITILEADGSFGTRTIPVPAASRYIHSCKKPILDMIFPKEDDKVLIQQMAEETIIEPKFFVPVIPLLVINGSEGVGNGHAQKILARNPTEVITWIYNYLNKKPQIPLNPYHAGFTGSFVPTDQPNVWDMWGKMEKGQYCSIVVTDVPPVYTSASWIAKLDILEEKKIIKSYIDESNDNTFKTTIKVDRSFLELSVPEQYKTLGLIKSYTENYTCMDEENKIREFKSIEEIMEEYCDIRLEYYEKRRLNQLKDLRYELLLTEMKYDFIRAVIDGKILIAKKTKKELENELINLQFIQKNDTFDYLLNMPIHSMTTDKLEALFAELEKKQAEVEYLENITPHKMWIKELKEIAKAI